MALQKFVDLALSSVFPNSITFLFTYVLSGSNLCYSKKGTTRGKRRVHFTSSVFKLKSLFPRFFT